MTAITLSACAVSLCIRSVPVVYPLSVTCNTPCEICVPCWMPLSSIQFEILTIRCRGGSKSKGKGAKVSYLWLQLQPATL